ncbi:MAG: aldehyde dehydrogenase [Bacteroidales bacterium]|nr:aldehyde dehydrogenase [Bacteroidales bacterium]MBQ9723031.1 aldehyde dehydrogenase [Bacteroidales bacterium]
MSIENTSVERIDSIVKAQKDFFRSGATLDVRFRKDMLCRFRFAMAQWEKRICDALWTDLHKSYEEAYLTEISIVNNEIMNHIEHVKKWSGKRKACSPLKLFPSRSYIVKEPLGNTLIISPWNYPVQLLLNPLVGAISAGCTAVLKPSPYVPNVSKVIEEMIKETFDEKYVAVVQGNREVNSALLDKRWDLIFFTGSPALAKTVMASAAKNLTPVILELGGKSPCIIDRTADIRTAARRIAWGKTLNSGQTCIAPDYLLIHKDVKESFVKAFAEEVRSLHGEDIKADRHYVRMVNDKAFERVTGYFKDGKIIYGGRTDAESRFIEPTLIEEVAPDSPLMTEEIFGPVFPVIAIGDNFREKVIEFVNSREKPLAFYYFGKESDGWEIIRRTSSGGGCINDVIMHIANENVPFGGVGNSGMGRYHSKDSFEAFSHTRSIVCTGTWIDLPFRYMPYKMFSLIKKIL